MGKRKKRCMILFYGNPLLDWRQQNKILKGKGKLEDSNREDEVLRGKEETLLEMLEKKKMKN